jgi:hypothetical protein
MAENVQVRTGAISDVTPAGDAAAFKLKQALQVAEGNGFGNEPAIVAAIMQAMTANAQVDAIERAAARLEKALTSGTKGQPTPP